MRASIGVDVGTTDTKCCVLMDDAVVFETRMPTAVLKVDAQMIFFDPRLVWDQVANMLQLALDKVAGANHCVISIVCQAPSICAWSASGFSLGVSYLAHYGDPTRNSKVERRSKSQQRISDLLLRIPMDQECYFSCLTGYLVYQATGVVTVDAITAWEMGIEQTSDEEAIWSQIFPHTHPLLAAPFDRFSLNCSQLLVDADISLQVLAGTTDSAVLPLYVWPDFPEYHVYLGTWGSLLQTWILSSKAYCRSLWSGDLHTWMISVPDFAQRYRQDTQVLTLFLSEVATRLPKGASLGISGGLLRSKRPEILNLTRHFLPDSRLILAPDNSTAIGAARLGLIALDENCEEEKS